MVSYMNIFNFTSSFLTHNDGDKPQKGLNAQSMKINDDYIYSTDVA